MIPFEAVRAYLVETDNDKSSWKGGMPGQLNGTHQKVGPHC